MERMTKGTRVRHESKTHWGVGQLLEGESSNGFRIYFENVGLKEISSDYRNLIHLVLDKEAASGLLDNLALPIGPQARPPLTPAQAKERFLELFPGGFQGERLEKGEREYKVQLHIDALALLGKPVILALLMAGDFAGVCQRARKFIDAGKLNLISPYEKIAFNNGMAALQDPQPFALALNDWLYGAGSKELRFNAMSNALDELGAAKWPVMTSFGFFVDPSTEVFIKPENLKYAAALFHFEINYKPDLNWNTYDSVTRFYCHLHKEVSDLGPRDMIDVQDFIWCIDPKNYGH